MASEASISRVLKRAGEASRLALMALTLAGILSASLWLWKPRWISRLDGWIVQKHEERYRIPLKQALSSMEEGKKLEAVEKLGNLLSDMESVRKQDRLAPLKTRAFEAMTRILVEEKEFSRALRYYENWIAYDDRDLRARAGKGWTLLAMPDRKAQGKALLKELYRKVPYSPVVMSVYVDFLMEGDDLTDAFLVCLNYWHYEKRLAKKPFSSYEETAWTIVRGSESGLDEESGVSVYPVWTKDGAMRLSCPMPPGSTCDRFKIVPPAGVQGAIADFSPGLRLPLGRERPVAFRPEMELHEMELRDESTLVANGNGSFFVVLLAEPLKGREDAKLFFEARVEWLSPPGPVPFPRRFAGVLRDPSKVARLAQDLRSRGEAQAVEGLKEALRREGAGDLLPSLPEDFP